jgi:hypothetical protein
VRGEEAAVEEKPVTKEIPVMKKVIPAKASAHGKVRARHETVRRKPGVTAEAAVPPETLGRGRATGNESGKRRHADKFCDC